MANAGEVVKLGNSSVLTSFQRFYRSLAFDITFGAVPVVLLGLYNLIMATFFTIPSLLLEGKFFGFKLLLVLFSFLIMLSCVSLLVSIFGRRNLNVKATKYCLVGLWCGIPFALLWIVVNVMSAISLPSQMSVNLFLAYFALPAVFVVIKHINLLRK